MLREIRGIEQRNLQRVRRWFQDDYFDLYVWQDRAGAVLRFQLCYERDTHRERAPGAPLQAPRPESAALARPSA